MGFLRGLFNISLHGTSKGPNTYYYNGTTPQIPWNANPKEVKSAIETLSGCTIVEVTRYRLSKYGAHTWNVTFTENPNQHPPGTGDIRKLDIEIMSLTESASFKATALHACLIHTNRALLISQWRNCKRIRRTEWYIPC